MKLAIALGLVVATAAAPTVRAADPGLLESRLAEVVAKFPGTMGVAVKNLDTGASISVHGDVRFPTASLIKVAVMVEVFHQIAEGKLRPDTPVTLAAADKAGDETVPLNVCTPAPC